MILPPCDYRVPTVRDELFYCRHPKVHSTNHLVTWGACDRCTVRMEVATPRPYPSPERLSANPPPIARQVWNLATALVDYVADGLRNVTREQYQRRLEVCDDCPERDGTRCLQCGCYLALKAQARVFGLRVPARQLARGA